MDELAHAGRDARIIILSGSFLEHASRCEMPADADTALALRLAAVSLLRPRYERPVSVGEVMADAVADLRALEADTQADR